MAPYQTAACLACSPHFAVPVWVQLQVRHRSSIHLAEHVQVSRVAKGQIRLQARGRQERACVDKDKPAAERAYGNVWMPAPSPHCSRYAQNESTPSTHQHFMQPIHPLLPSSASPTHLEQVFVEGVDTGAHPCIRALPCPAVAAERVAHQAALAAAERGGVGWDGFVWMCVRTSLPLALLVCVGGRCALGRCLHALRCGLGWTRC